MPCSKRRSNVESSGGIVMATILWQRETQLWSAFGWERLAMTIRLAAMVFALAGVFTVGPLDAAEFKSDAKTNSDIAKKLRISVFFTVPDTARVELPTSINTTVKLIDFDHPDAK